KKAGEAALADAKVPFAEVQQAFAGYVYGDSTCGQRAIYQLGLSGIPVFNVNNNCSTGSSALMLGTQAVAGGMAECVIVVGFEQIMQSPEVFDPLTRYQCCPPTCGAAAAVLCSDDFAKKHGISKPVYIAGQVMTTDFPSSFGEHSMIKMVGFDMAKSAAKKLYEMTGIGPDDVDVV